MDSDFETVLDLVGSYGRFQRKLLMFIVTPVSFYVAMTSNLVFFQFIVPDYWCSVPGRNSSLFSMQEWKNMTIPMANDGSFEKCLQYGSNLTGTNNFFISNETHECIHGYEHARSLFWETAATDKEWLCKKEKYSTHIIAINLAGCAIGALLLPLLADRIYGRKTMFFIAIGIHITFNSALLIWHQFHFVAVFIFFIGLSPIGASQMPYVTTLEFINPDHRTITSFHSFVAWTFGMCSAAIVAFLVPHWWYLSLICVTSSIVIIGFGRFLPESPRWLLSKGKLERCAKILMEVAKTNGKQDFCERELKRKLQILCEKEKMSNVTTIKDVLKFPRICRNAILTQVIGSLTWITYSCVLLNMDLIPNSHFLNFFILSIIELPSNVIAWLSVDFLGRRMTSFLTYAAATFFSLLSLIYVRERIVLLCMVAFVKLFATEGVYIVYTLATEIFPTPIRATGVGIVIITANLLGMVSPYIIDVGETFLYSMLIILNCICMLISPLLPETLGLPLPQTLQEAETLGQERPFWKWINYWNQNKLTHKS